MKDTLLNDEKIEETNGLQDIIFPKVICITDVGLKPDNKLHVKAIYG